MYLFDDVVELIDQWEPKKYSRESQYQNDLIKFLRKELNKEGLFGFSEKHSIRKETGRSLADIGIDGKIGIEIKNNLNTKSKTDRLFGQIDDYLRNYEEVIVVLCGKTNEEHLDYLEEKVRDIPSGGLFGPEIKIIVKDGKKKKQDTFW